MSNPLYKLILNNMKPEKKSFALRLDVDMMRKIERWAEEEYRSTNSQIEWMLAYMIRYHGKGEK